MSADLISRAEILFQQKRYKEAGEILSNILREDPNNASLLAMYSQVLLELDKKEGALDMINNAIQIAPDEDHLYFIKAIILIQTEKLDEAEQFLEQAIAINPGVADYHSYWGSVKLIRKQFKDALDLANKSLELDAENLIGLNIRSRALLKLDQKDESYQTIEGALKEDPNNPYTHANFGWSLLEKGDNKKALFHFKEALKNDPNFEYAQAGMVQALKARYFIYRLFLKYSFWMSNMTSKYQWGVIIGFYLLFRFLRSLASNNETLQPYLIPILVILGVMAFSTWIINPVSNLFLRLNSFGKHLLDKDEIRSSNFVGISAAICLIGVILFAFLGAIHWLALAVYGFAMMVPLGLMFTPSKVKNGLVYYALFMAIIGAFAIAISFQSGELFNLFSAIFIFSFIAFQWIGNFIMIREDNK